MMDTPRSGLVRMTETAIQQLVKDDCERSLPTIRRLETISYELWVESNTDFLSETVVTEGDDDDEGWMWDDDCFIGVTNSVGMEKNPLNSSLLSDCGSSLASSIRICSDSDCSMGYLASCESFLDAADDNGSPNDDVTTRTPPSLKAAQRLFAHNHTDASSAQHVNVIGDTFYDRAPCKRRLQYYSSDDKITQDEHKHGLKSCEMCCKKNADDKCVAADTSADRADLCSIDEWVVIDECNEQQEDIENDWFTISIPRHSQMDDVICRHKNQWSVSDAMNSHSDKTEINNVCESYKGVDLEMTDWSILSVKITERLHVRRESGPHRNSYTDSISESQNERTVLESTDIVHGRKQSPNLCELMSDQPMLLNSLPQANDWLVVCLVMPKPCK